MKKVSVFRLFIMTVLYSLAANFAHPVTPAFIQGLHLHDYMFGVAFACMSVSNFLFSPFWGKAERTFGIARSIGFCFFGYAFAQYLFGSAATESGIIIARLLGGFFVGGISVGVIIYIMDHSPEGSCGRNLATAATLSTVFSAFGYMIGGFLGDISIRLTFMCQVAGLVLIGVLYLLFVGDETTGEVPHADSLLKNVNPFRAILDSGRVMSAAVVFFLFVCAGTSFASTCYEQCFNYFIRDQYGFPPSYNGILKALVGMITMAANATICVQLMKRTNIIRSVIPVILICFAMMVSIVMIRDMVPFIMMNVVFFGFNAVYQPLLQAMISVFSDSGDNGILVGVYNSMRSFGMVIGSLSAGFLYEADPKLSFVVSAAAFFLAAGAAWMAAVRAGRMGVSWNERRS